jgi:dienelactone hydrolase
VRAVLAAILATAAIAAPAADPRVPSTTFGEHGVQVGQPPLALGATLTMPLGKGPFPAVVLVAGSGPHDRDETIGADKPFRDIARGLSERGIAVLRYDKRTMAHPLEVIGNKDFTIDSEYTEDAVAAVELLQSEPGVDPHRVFVLGHSQGAQMAPRIAQRDPQVAGLILVAAPAHPLFDEILRQIDYLAKIDPQHAAHWRSEHEQAVRQRVQIDAFDPSHPEAPAPYGTTAAYWLSLRGYDAVATAEKLDVPMLILQGGRDWHVTPQDDFSRWQTAFAHDSRVTLHEYPGLSHLMMPAGDPPSPANDVQPAHVDARVIADIASWIEAQAPRR